MFILKSKHETEIANLERELDGVMKRLNACKIRDSIHNDRAEMAERRIRELCEANFELEKRLHRFDRKRGAGGRFVAVEGAEL